MSVRILIQQLNELTSVVGVDSAEHTTIGTTDVVDDNVSWSTIVLAVTAITDQLAVG
jgi:hypothetical protein